VIDVGVAERNLYVIYKSGIEMILLNFFAFAGGMLYADRAAKAAYGFGAAIREAEYRAVQNYSFRDLDKFRTSSLVTRMTNDTTVLQNAIINGLRPVTRGPVMMIMGVILSFFLSPRLAVVFFVMLPVLTLITFFIVKKIAPMFETMQGIVDHVNSIVQENLTAVRAVKAFVRGDFEEKKFDSVNTELMQMAGSTFSIAQLNQPAFQTVLYTAMILMMWFGGKMIIGGVMTVGELTGFLSYVMQVLNSVMMVSAGFLLVTRSLASAVRISEVLSEVPDIAEPAHPVTEVKDGSVDFEDVSFRYGENASAFALDHVTLHFKSGSTVGIIGGTGSAKTTLVQLIPRLYEASAGRVLVGGKDVREYDSRTLHDAVAMVLQKNLLFSGTILDNLRWGKKDASREEIAEALKISCADEFTDRFPEGLDTDLGQGGVNVSGGQKQRLCIARAVLKKPKILILDDAVSAVDTATNRKIQAGLKSLEGMTKIIIAQRVSLVMDADQIVILDNGKIHAVGTHESLLKSDPIYQEIWNTQTGGQDNG
jgi:ABC-type multidrug transport system fused ATPase/permease subunit